MAKKQQALNKGSKGRNRNGSEAFVAKYANKPDVLQLDSGLMYRILEDVQGPAPTMQNEVVVNQRILNFDGSVIADTYKSGFTDRFTLKEAIPGLQEGLQLMALLSRYEFVLPLILLGENEV